MSAKTKGVRSVRRMWALESCVDTQPVVHCYDADGPGDDNDYVHVAIVKIGMGNVGQMIDKAAKAIAEERYPGTNFRLWEGSHLEAVRNEARAVLTAILGRLPK